MRRGRDDEGGGGGVEDFERRKRGPQSNSIRNIQFDTARRILFGADLLPGTNREFWTTAGFVREDQIGYVTPFPLGPFTFMVTEGAKDPRAPNIAFSAVVWIQLSQHLVDFEDEIVTPVYDSLRFPGILHNSGWLAIGILRSDVFLPIVSNFMSFVRLDTHEDHPSYIPNDMSTTISSFDGGNAITARTAIYGGRYLAVKDPEDYAKNNGYEYGTSDAEEFLENDEFWELETPINLEWVQAPNTTLLNVLKIDEEEVFSDDYLSNRGGEVVPGHHINMRVHQNGGQVDVQYEGVIPLNLASAYMGGSDANLVPRSVLDTMLIGDGPNARVNYTYNAPCHYMYINTTLTGRFPVSRTDRGVWLAGDMAAVAYAQSWFLHVLRGPDPRRYGVQADWNTDPMRETMLPEPAFGLRWDSELRVYSLEAFGSYPGGSTEFTSLQFQVRFFHERLTTRSARIFLRNANLELTRPEFLGHRLQTIANSNPELWQQIALAFKRLQDMKKLEFLGSSVCHGCLKRNKTLKYEIEGARLKVCSKACGNKLMRGSNKIESV
jgi:hypothetical protein